MANQTNKSTEGNTSNNKTTGQGSGASATPARETNLTSGAGNQNSPMTGSGSQSFGSTGGGTAVEAAKDTAKNLVDQAKTTASGAYEAVAEKATSKLEEQKSTLAGGLSSVAESVRSMGDNLNQSPEKNPLADYTAQYANTAAQKLEQFAGYFERKDVKDMARDIEGFARRNPALFLGGAFALGILAGRFIKSTPPMQSRSFHTGIDHQLPPAGGRSTSTGTTGMGTGSTSAGLGNTPGSSTGTNLGSTGSTPRSTPSSNLGSTGSSTGSTPGSTGTKGNTPSTSSDKPNFGKKPGTM